MNNVTALGCEMTINNHTRFSENCKPTLLEHMYTNLIKKDTYSGVALYELSDHIPTIIIAKNAKCALKSETKFKRCMKNFILKDFFIDLNEKLSKMKLDSININSDVDNVLSTFMSVLDKHAPLRPMSIREKHLSKNIGLLSAF